MSCSLTGFGQFQINQQPPTWIQANLRAGTQDYRGVSYWQTLQNAGSFIQTLGTLTVARADQLPLQDGDLVITPPGNTSVTAPWAVPDYKGRYPGGNSQVNWWAGATAIVPPTSNGCVLYIITIPFVTTTGEPLSFDAYQLVTPLLG